MKKILVVLIMVCLGSILVSANGLNIVGDSSFIINKTIGEDEIIIFTISNDDSFTFYNISFEDNPYISMPQIGELTAGSSQNITATISSNSEIIQGIRIQGYYESLLGVSNETYEINIDYDDGIDECSLVAIKGDKVKWNNFVNDEIKLINSDTSLEITTIASNASYLSPFENPEVLNYYATRRGFQFTDVCQIVALGDSGLINNPLYDTFLYLTITTNYDPTTLSTTFLETSYTMNFNGEEEGIFNIKNTGSNVAKNVFLDGEWFDFSANNFDLEPGATKGLIYYIRPIVTSTNETNKTHSKNITISGNFESVNQPMDIFINYADIDSGNYSSSASLNDLLIKFCEDNPNICNPAPEIVYKNANEASVNVTTSTKQLKEIFEYLFEQGDNFDVFENYLKEEIQNIYSSLNSTNLALQGLSNETKEMKESKEGSDSFLIFLIVISFLLVIAGGGGWIYFDHKKQLKLKKMRRM